MRASVTRRALLAATAALMVGGAHAQVPSRIVVFDWGLVETLLALGIVPVGIAERDGYDTWVMEPALPSGVADVGLRVEPNLEAVARLKPDLILLTPQMEAQAPLLARIAPTLTLAIFAPGGDVWTRAADVAVALSAALGRPEAGADLLGRAHAVLAEVAPRVCSPRRAPALSRELRRCAPCTHLCERVAVRCGPQSPRPDQRFCRRRELLGLRTLGIEHLAAPADAGVLIFEPVPREARPTMEHGPLWQRLPAVAAGRVALLPPVWSFGGLPSAMRFARLLGAQVDDPALRRMMRGGAGG